MGISVSAIILRTKRIQETVQFYRALGLELREEPGDDPTVANHFTCELNHTRFSIYSMEINHQADRRAAGQETMLGFIVDSVEQTVNLLTTEGNQVLLSPELGPTGYHSIVLDPDGRPVELTEHST